MLSPERLSITLLRANDTLSLRRKTLRTLLHSGNSYSYNATKSIPYTTMLYDGNAYASLFQTGNSYASLIYDGNA